MDLHSGYPFWLIKDGLPFSYPKLDHPLKSDVVIMGGGISGALTAYFLVDAGVECVLVDARTIGLGSTCASTALLQYEIDVPLFRLKDMVGEKNAVRAYELCVDAVEGIGRLAKRLHFDRLEPRKSLYYAAWKKDIGFLEKEYEARKHAGIGVSFLESQMIRDRFGFEAPAAILSECGANVDAYGLTHALLQHAMQKGLKVFDRTSISRIDHRKHGVSMQTGNGCRIEARKLVYATGYEIVKYIDEKIVDLHSTYATISEQQNGEGQLWPEDIMIWNTANPYLYMRTTLDRRVIVGGRDEKYFNPGRRDKLIHKKARQLATDFGRIFPHMEFKPEFCWTGTFGSTKDGLPYIGSYKKLINSYFSLGFGGNGIVFGYIAAGILTDIILGKHNTDADIFTFER
jgi:glycine/D-amino acid oxidase-like deaminating enzyme